MRIKPLRISDKPQLSAQWPDANTLWMLSLMFSNIVNNCFSNNEVD